MQVKNKIFPYPVINNNTYLSDFGESRFDFLFEQDETDSAFILKNARFETDSIFVNSLYKNSYIVVYCIIECSDTVYREKIELDTQGKDIILRKVDFTERVDVSMYAVATKDFIYSSQEFGEDYKGIDLEIEKNDIIGANDGFRLMFNHEEDEDSFAHSIFSIITSHEMDDGAYMIECSTGRKIVVTMSDGDYKNYKTIYTVPVFKEVFFNMILVPALIEGLSLCQMYLNEMEGRDLDDVGNQFIWFRAIVASYKILKGCELVTEDFKKISPAYLAQELLGKPFGGALDKLVKETKPNIDIGGDDE